MNAKRRLMMRKLVLGAVIAALLLTSVPAAAQDAAEQNRQHVFSLLTSINDSIATISTLMQAGLTGNLDPLLMNLSGSIANLERVILFNASGMIHPTLVFMALDDAQAVVGAAVAFSPVAAGAIVNQINTTRARFIALPIAPEAPDEPPPEPAPEPPAPPPPPAIVARPSTATVLVNGEAVAFAAYNVGGNNFFKLRDLAYTLAGTEKQFNVEWDAQNAVIALTRGEAYVAVGGEMTGRAEGEKTTAPTAARIMLNGREVAFTAYLIGDNNYFRLRDIGEAFDFGVTWDGERQTILIDTSVGYTPE